jgi:hypothetical protein
VSYQSFKLSSFVMTEEPIIGGVRLAIIYQDLDELDLLTDIDKIVNKLIYPLWSHGISIMFISKLELVRENFGEHKGGRENF